MKFLIVEPSPLPILIPLVPNIVKCNNPNQILYRISYIKVHSLNFQILDLEKNMLPQGQQTCHARILHFLTFDLIFGQEKNSEISHPGIKPKHAARNAATLFYSTTVPQIKCYITQVRLNFTLSLSLCLSLSFSFSFSLSLSVGQCQQKRHPMTSGINEEEPCYLAVKRELERLKEYS